jgi:hypothetical protein
MNARGRRATVDDYASWVSRLCGMPPGAGREECEPRITRRLLAMYLEHGVTPPPRLAELAQRIGVTAGAELP